MNHSDQIKLVTAFLFGALVNIISQYALQTYTLTQDTFFIVVALITVAIIILWRNGGKHF